MEDLNVNYMAVKTWMEKKMQLRFHLSHSFKGQGHFMILAVSPGARVCS